MNSIAQDRKDSVARAQAVNQICTEVEESDKEESEYEEISEHLLSKLQSTHNSVMKNNKTGSKGCCALCGNLNPLVQCDLCGNQLFCAECNEMYHRHPRRQNHIRKLLTVLENRPPIPPKLNSTAPGTPVPPPRRNRGMQLHNSKGSIAGSGLRSATSSPCIARKAFDPFGSLKRFVTSGKSSPVMPSPIRRFSNQTTPSSSEAYLHNSAKSKQRSFSVTNASYLSDGSCNPGGFKQPTIPLTVLEFSGNSRKPSLKENHDLGTSRNWGHADEQELGFIPFLGKEPRNNCSSSSSNLHRIPRCSTINPSSHFATIQRRYPAERFCSNSSINSQIVSPPPIPPRDFNNSCRIQRPIQSSRQFMMHENMRRATSLSGEGQLLMQRDIDDLIKLKMEGFHPVMSPSVKPHSTRDSTKQYHSTLDRARPLPPVPRSQSITVEHEYYSGDVSEEDLEDGDDSKNPRTPDPMGPWSCEHCTFINPMSTRFCTVCCKTPSCGYKMVKASTPLVASKLSFSIPSHPKPIHRQNLITQRGDDKDIVKDECLDSKSSSGSSEENEEVKLIEAQASPNPNLTGDIRGSETITRKILVDSSTGDYSIIENISPKQQPAKPLLTDFQKVSKGTSPLPQEMATQTYEMIPISQTSDYKTSTQSLATSISRGISPQPPPQVEMSQKAMRLARRAQQQLKLKRSASTHLTNYPNSRSMTSGPWPDFPLDYMKYNENHSRARSHHNSEGIHLYRSGSRNSLASDTRSLPISGPTSRESSPPPIPEVDPYYFDDFNKVFPQGYRNWDSKFPSTPAEYFASIEDLVMKQAHRSPKSELTQLLQEAEQSGFTPEDLQVALKMCGERNHPIKWLQENWSNMVETVQTLGTKFGRDNGKESNEVGTISVPEAKEALRLHKGNVWRAVTHVVESRKSKFNEIKARGSFTREDILTALTAKQGNLEAAYLELSKNQLKPFLMRIWGPPTGQENESGAPETEFIKSPSKTTKEIPSESQVPADSQNMDASSPIKQEEGKIDAKISRSIDSSEDPDSEESISNFIQNFGISQSSVLKTSANKDAHDETRSLHITNNNETNVPSSESIATIANAVKVITEKLSAILLTENKNPLIKSQEVIKTNSFNCSPTPPQSLHRQQPYEGIDSASTSSLENSTSDKVNVRHDKSSTDYFSNKNKPSKLYKTIGSFAASFFKPTAKPLITNLVCANSSISEVVECEKLNERKTPATEFVQLSNISDHNPNQDPPHSDILLDYDQHKEKVESFSETANTSESSNNENEISQSTVIPAQIQEDNVLLDDTFVRFDDSDEEIDSSSSFSSSLIMGKDTGSQNATLTVKKMDNGSMLESKGESNPIRQSDSDSSSSISGKQLSETQSSSEEEDFDLGQELTGTNVSSINVNENEDRANLQTMAQKIDQLVSDGKVESPERGKIFMQLLEMNFNENESLVAAKECSSLSSAISFLQQECLLCAGRYSAKQMIAMLRCTHMCCRSCATDYFTIQIRDRSILQATCPFCKEPFVLDETETGNGNDPTETLDYFSHLDILLKGLLEGQVYELFVRKLRDWTLAKLPNFKWCSKCSSGFITEPLQTHLICPDCNAVTCAICLEPWDKLNHAHAKDHLDRMLFCDEILSPNAEVIESKSNSQLIIEYLNQNCLQCPKCGTKFSLTRGGCMHLTCTNCHHEFCSGCLASFSMGLKCKNKEGSSAFCGKLGLHAHHPRNCLFYLRDKEPGLLEKLLSEFNVGFMSSDDLEQRTRVKSKKCQVPMQRETQDGFEDGFCDQETMTVLPLICKNHYVEYLGLQIWEHNLDPVSILSNDDLETIIRRCHKKLPPRPYGVKEDELRIKLLDVIKAEIPIENGKK